MISDQSVRKDTRIFQVKVGPTEFESYADRDILQLRLIRYVDPKTEGFADVEPAVRSWSLVSSKWPKLAPRELTSEQARGILEGYYMEQAGKE